MPELIHVVAIISEGSLDLRRLAQPLAVPANSTGNAPGEDTFALRKQLDGQLPINLIAWNGDVEGNRISRVQMALSVPRTVGL